MHSRVPTTDAKPSKCIRPFESLTVSTKDGNALRFEPCNAEVKVFGLRTTHRYFSQQISTNRLVS